MKFLKGLIFENFKSTEAFLKYFFQINKVIMHMHFWNILQRPMNNGTSEIF